MPLTLPITFDKSHLVTLGEKLYQEGVELIRELVCNAYDADAMNVWIDVDQYQIKVRDDDSGMDLCGLKQYLTIGSEEKVYNSISPRFQRQRIGQFGIGKFAVLSAARVFKVFTQKERSALHLIFDEKMWREVSNWDVPIHELDYDPIIGNGTLVTLEQLKKSFSLPQIERVIRERTPLRTKNFQVFLNRKRVEAYRIPGKSFPVSEETDFGTVKGEVIIPHFSQKIEEAGVEITVKGVMIRRETFGIEFSHVAFAHRITGSIAADFLPVTSDRTRFLVDTAPYLQFHEAMQRVMKKILRILREQQQERVNQKTDKVLRTAMHFLRKALRKNQTFSLLTSAPTAQSDTESLIAKTHEEHAGLEEVISDEAEVLQPKLELQSFDQPADGKPNEPRIKKIRIKNPQGRELTARKIKIGELDIICTFEELGVDAPEYLNELGVIIINRSHKLFRRVEKKEELLQEYLLRLIAQELARQYYPHDSTKAFALMNELLRDAV